MTNRVIVGITGATGQRYGIKALELLRGTDAESHLILSPAAKVNLAHEESLTPGDVIDLADVTHECRNIGAGPASGSFVTAGMIVVPCSMKTLSNVANGNAGNLITRAADVTLKERRPLVLMPRESPFNRIHLQNMIAVNDAGGLIVPPFPAFYNNPRDVDEMVTQTMARALSYLGMETDVTEWMGLRADQE